MATPAVRDVACVGARRLRRSRCLVSYWDAGAFVLENYLSGLRLQTDALLLPLLSEWTDFLDAAVIGQRLEETLGSAGWLAVLEAQGVLTAEDSEADRKERLIDRWPWGQAARFFHYATRHAAFTFDFEAIRAALEEKALRDPPPSPFRRVGEGSLALLQYDAWPMLSLHEVLLKRRTVRAFDRVDITLPELSAVIGATWGYQRFYNGSLLDRRLLKTSPSGGARHPIEVYVVVMRVDGVPPGVYHYRVADHTLGRLDGLPSEATLVEVFGGQSWVAEASAAFLMTAVLPRSWWKYDHDRAYRVVLLDAGHLGQTFHLVCTSLGLGPFTTAALNDAAGERILQVDGVNEVLLYGAAVGRTARWPGDA